MNQPSNYDQRREPLPEGISRAQLINRTRPFFFGRTCNVADMAFQRCRVHLKNGNLPRRHLPINQTRDCFSGEFKKRP